jgi:hypothetical protein
LPFHASKDYCQLHLMAIFRTCFGTWRSGCHTENFANTLIPLSTPSRLPQHLSASRFVNSPILFVPNFALKKPLVRRMPETDELLPKKPRKQPRRQLLALRFHPNSRKRRHQVHDSSFSAWRHTSCMHSVIISGASCSSELQIHTQPRL